MKRILFVDDEPLILRGLERSLSDRADAWDMSFVTSGEAALAALGSRAFDLVVTDIRMPGMNGAELLGEVMRRHPGVARIVLSGQADQELVYQCVTAAHQYLSKPCEPTVLAAAVSRVLEIQSLVQSEAIRTLVAHLQRLPSCPDLYRRTAAALASPHTELEQIGAIVEQDIAMTAKLLKLVNSAFFGLSHQVDTAAEAVSYLGIEVLNALVLSIQFFDSCRNFDQAGLNVDALWRRALLTAKASRALARVERQPRSLQDEAFTAGMLHNCGLLVLADNVPDRLAEAIERARQAQAPLERFEREVYGASQAEVGGYLLGLWGLPLSIVEAVARQSRLAADASRGAGTAILVHAADALLAERAQTIEGVPGNRLNTEALDALGLSDREPAWRKAVAAVIGGD